MSLLLDGLNDLSKLMFSLVIVSLVIGAIVLAAVIFANVTKLILFFRYHKYNKQQSSSGLTAAEAARSFLDSNGLQDVKVKKLGFFRALFYGNHYDIFSKTVYLRRSIINSKSVTAVGLALQKVGLALQHKEGGAKFKTKAVLGQLAVFGPVIFLPIAAVGLILDAFLFDFTGVASIVGIVIGFVFYFVATIFTLLNVSVEKRANNQALLMLEKSGLFDETDLAGIRDVFKSYILSYIADAILAVLKLLQYSASSLKA